MGGWNQHLKDHAHFGLGLGETVLDEGSQHIVTYNLSRTETPTNNIASKA